MRSTKLFTRKKAKNGEGRQAVIKHLLLPEEVIKELRLYKDAYSVCFAREKDELGNPIPIKVSWEQMLRRWMDNVGRFDKDVKDYVKSLKAHLATNQSSVYDDFTVEKTVPFMFSETASTCIRKAAAEEGMTPEDWLLGVVSLNLLSNSGYSNLKDYLEDDIEKNSQYDSLRRLIRDRSDAKAGK